MSESNLPIVRPPKPGERILAVKERAVLPTQKRKRDLPGSHVHRLLWLSAAGAASPGFGQLEAGGRRSPSL